MTQEELIRILSSRYGIADAALGFLRESGGQVYLIECGEKYLLKVIGSAFAATARQSFSLLRYLEESGFPVPGMILTKTGAPFCQTEDGQMLLVQKYIEGDEPDLTKSARKVGELTAWLHELLEAVPGALIVRDMPFFIGRYLDYLHKRAYPRACEYAALGETLWSRVCAQPTTACHGDLHRGNLLESADGQIFFLDFDTVCRAPAMFDVSVMCDMTDYFRLKEADVETTRRVYAQFLSGYETRRGLTDAEKRSFDDWIAIRHFQLQATIVEIHGPDCINEAFIDAQLAWLRKWMEISEK